MSRILRQQEGIFYWTKHSLEKLREYNLSQQRVRRVLHHPTRTEIGIVPETWASMQLVGSKKHPYEIWVMYAVLIQNSIDGKKRIKKSQAKSLTLITSNIFSKNIKQIKIISAWKYPGITKPGEPIPIPLDILEEIMNNYK